ncbi:hypothetical protein CLU79DRAFT_733367 [Phycomyces nitens]|nr:hypothetical protein CLU79DRAFT_733367 [Phycomyces nitens]
MYRELGLLAVLFLPIFLAFFYRSQTLAPQDTAKKPKKKSRYARVLRIKTEEEEESFGAVPLEDGWSRQSVRPRTSASTTTTPEPLTKKQRENMARAAKRKEEKESQEALQAARLRRHKQQLDREKINAFYSSGPGKNTPWGKNGKVSAKVPTSSASLNEHGQLIWD